jgi:hypothetical protein
MREVLKTRHSRMILTPAFRTPATFSFSNWRGTELRLTVLRGKSFGVRIPREEEEIQTCGLRPLPR